MTARRDAAPRRSLDTAVTYLPGVGPGRADALRRLGIFSVRDLFFHIPHRYEDASTITPIARLHVGSDATVIGTVVSKGIIPTRKGLRVFQAVLQDESGLIEASWPGQPFLDRTIRKDDVLLLTGPVRFFHGRQLVPREFVNLGAADAASGTSGGRVLSVYPATEGLSFKVIRGLIEKNLDLYLPLFEEYIPNELLTAAKVPTIGEALRAVHRPGSLAEAQRGRARLAYEELLFVQLLQLRAKSLAREARGAIRFSNKRDLTTRLKLHLPFELTTAQVRATREIVKDMCSGRRMHRLLQGDVGSGKTIVALFAALLAMENGWQAAIMAPTELLAEQHTQTLETLLAPLGLSPVLITGSLSAKARKAAAVRLSSDDPVLVVGTHALVQGGTQFARLGLAIVDEQHRFGVQQRNALGKKGQRPDILLMSATPIPRSLALTLYGDLDVSVLDERPPGRKRVMTARRPEEARARVLDFVDQQLDLGRQAYVVLPLIEESDKSQLRAATRAFDELRSGRFSHRRVALLHGRQESAEKDATMRRFRDGELDVLVSTTVIEVGIDVANASVMLIEHPERFGLSQLHQMRGRVGRGAEESFCILLGDVSPDAADRLDLLVRSDDGFEIASADLRLRGMGDLFGERQHGEQMFKVADPLRDQALSALAREGAALLLKKDPDLASSKNKPMHDVLRKRYARALELFGVG
ncbi:MAG TPA: ATP-dependent DNA helicase RecG [Gemmatimonadaceae bacterium]|nr:ATP-dependent DNA helicase RecG [Gemmatimonadaceae bacterium]